VPKELKNREKINQMGVPATYLQYADEGGDMLNRILTVDKSWVHHYQAESQRALMQSKQTSQFTFNQKV
jgi:hypothetical protein